MKSFTALQISVRIIAVTAGRSTSTKVRWITTAVWAESWERDYLHIREGEENTMIMREDGYCPFLNEKKLCDICIKMGEEALSEICTEFPCFTMEYEDVREKILSLACEEVGNIMFSTDEKITWRSMRCRISAEPGTMTRQR